MKTAISIPDKLFKNVKKTAEKIGVSRSRIFSLAVEEYLNNHYPVNVTEKLNQIYSTNSSDLDNNLNRMQLNTNNEESWEW